MSMQVMSIAAVGRNVRAETAGSQTGTGTGNNTDTSNDTNSSAKTSTGTPGMLDRDAFLKLLVAQLKYQDPSKPMDATEMVSQSAQLTMVDKLDSISAALESSALTDKLGLAASVIGKEVTFTSSDGVTVKDTVRSVRFQDGQLVLHTGDWDVPMNVVTAIGAAPATPVVPETPDVTPPDATTPDATTPDAATPDATTGTGSGTGTTTTAEPSLRSPSR